MNQREKLTKWAASLETDSPLWHLVQGLIKLDDWLGCTSNVGNSLTMEWNAISMNRMANAITFILRQRHVVGMEPWEIYEPYAYMLMTHIDLLSTIIDKKPLLEIANHLLMYIYDINPPAFTFPSGNAWQNLYTRK